MRLIALSFLNVFLLLLEIKSNVTPVYYFTFVLENKVLRLKKKIFLILYMAGFGCILKLMIIF